ncbi:MAG TPA: MarR family winged helix-turn-helix transcriptional regulator [Burkholderiaceae bacterium]|nr:MarR family winged helix-turn-helix transcriptional regulator [Burkholderiaceae bacterium]
MDALALPRGCSNLKLRQADRVVSRHYDRHLAEVGLKTSQYALLGHIAALMPVQPGLLAARLQMEPSTLTRNLQPLVAQGWVRVEAGRDARSRQVSLTEAGWAKHAEAKSAWKAAQTAFNERLGPQRVAALHALLDDCLQRMAEPVGESLAELPEEGAGGA